jgi:putative hemolysin
MKLPGKPMLDSAVRMTQPARSRFWVGLAVDDAEVAEAQRLRYRVFAEEMGARLPSSRPGLDIDA